MWRSQEWLWLKKQAKKYDGSQDYGAAMEMDRSVQIAELYWD